MPNRRDFLAGTSLLTVFGATRAFAQSEQHQYDSRGRLIVVTRSDGSTTTYSYDSAGNRTQVTTAGGSSTPTPTPGPTIIQVSGPGPKNLRTLADAAGYTGAPGAQFRFEVSGALYGNGGSWGSAGGTAIDTGVWPGGVTLALVLTSGAVVAGGGGSGGTSTSPTSPVSTRKGGDGGAGVNCQAPLSIEVQSGASLFGGGGGGGGGCPSVYSYPGGSTLMGGGGGGGGTPNGSGGAGASGPAGSPGTSGGGGSGGAASSGGGGGGAGGAYASAGTAGGSSSNGTGGAGGAAGYAVRMNGQVVNVTNNGTIAGTQG